MQRTCGRCGSSDMRYYADERWRCAECRRRRSRHVYHDGERERDRQRRAAQAFRQANVPRTILVDSRRWDKRRGLDNDLTAFWIEERLRAGCCYCGETQIRMTLDRIDNALGHLMQNCVAACVRCNYVRRTMPYEAWLEVSVAMRAARERGLFADWIGIAGVGSRK